MLACTERRSCCFREDSALPRGRTLHLLDVLGIDLKRDLVLHDLIDHDLKIRSAIAINERACAVDDLAEPSLDEGGQLESAAKFLDDVVALQCFNHGSWAEGADLRRRELV
jgi:hypothetical protein